MSSPDLVFDRHAVRLHRARAARRFAGFDFLFRAGAERLADRLADMTGRFPTSLELGAHGDILHAAVGSTGGIETLVSADLVAGFAARAGGPCVVADEEFLPFGDGRFDLVLSNLSLHWVNDLPGALIQIRNALRPDGLLLASMLGGPTLGELRACLIEAEAAVTDGASPRVSPFVDMRDAGALLQRAGFALPVVDSDVLTVTYSDALALMRDLRGMGETNAVAARPRHCTRRAILLRAADLYAQRFATGDGRVYATFDIVTLTGWAPSATQPQPLKPGSAKARLADALDVRERSAGEKAGPRG